MKYLKDFRVVENVYINSLYSLLKLTPDDGKPLADVKPGQFVQVLVPESSATLLRRPISINYVDKANNELWLLVRRAGNATNILADKKANSLINLLYPLGNGFTCILNSNGKTLLTGGGVGIAPLLYLGKILSDNNIAFEYLIGAKSKSDLLELDLLEKLATVNISTDNGSAGEKGLITHNSCLDKNWARIYCCGPASMMKAIAKIAHQRNIDCEVSLENMMACGLGACLCCVEKTVKGNVCVCTEGPIFNIKDLTW